MHVPLRLQPAFLCALALLAFLASSNPQTTSQKADQEPLSEEQLMALVTSSKLGELSVNRIVEIIQQRGIKFSITDVYLLELEAHGADIAVLETLRDLVKRGKDFVPSPKSPAPPDQATSPQTSPDPSIVPDWTKFLESVRAKALAYTDDLPNFICTQVTQRFARYFPSGWRQIDNYVAELSYFDKKEHYKILTVANQATNSATIENLSGTRSTGEFGTTLRALFDPATQASFRLEGKDEANARQTVRVGYQVSLDNSSRTINYNNEKTIVTAYRGRCWIDPVSFQVVRLEDKAINIPESFPITRSEGAIEYDLADISGKSYWLPVRAEVLLVEGGAKLHTRNVIEFKRYRKFEAEVKLVPDE